MNPTTPIADDTHALPVWLAKSSFGALGLGSLGQEKAVLQWSPASSTLRLVREPSTEVIVEANAAQITKASVEMNRVTFDFAGRTYTMFVRNKMLDVAYYGAMMLPERTPNAAGEVFGGMALAKMAGIDTLEQMLRGAGTELATVKYSRALKWGLILGVLLPIVFLIVGFAIAGGSSSH